MTVQTERWRRGGGRLITSRQNATLLFQDEGINNTYGRRVSGGGGGGGGTWPKKTFKMHSGDLNNELNFWTLSAQRRK